MLLNNELLLFKLKPPITNLLIHRERAFNHITVVINDRFAGQLKVTLEETPGFLLNLVEAKKEIGVINGGEVTWYLDTLAHGIEAVVDSNGNLHKVEEL